MIPKTENRTPNTGVSRTILLWLAAISLVITGMVWLTLSQIRSIAIEHAPTQEEIAQCRAELAPEDQANWTEHCQTEPNIVWAAHHPLRNSIGVFILLFAIGYLALVLNFLNRPPQDNIPRL